MQEQQAERARLAADVRERGDSWDRHRTRWYESRSGDGRLDPFYRRLRKAVDRATTVLDVGSGLGRLAVPLAPHVRALTAVDPSPHMLRILDRRAVAAGMTNVTAVNSSWQDAVVEPADVSFCSFAVYGVLDMDAFLRKLDAATRRTAFLYLSAFGYDWLGVEPFWRHFHDRPPLPGPTYLDAVAILEQDVGVHPRVEIVEMPTRTDFSSIADAVDEYRRALLLPKTAPVRRELTALLEPWLIVRNGAVRPPVRSTLSAIISWAPTPSGST